MLILGVVPQVVPPHFHLGSQCRGIVCRSTSLQHSRPLSQSLGQSKGTLSCPKVIVLACHSRTTFSMKLQLNYCKGRMVHGIASAIYLKQNKRGFELSLLGADQEAKQGDLMGFNF